MRLFQNASLEAAIQKKFPQLSIEDRKAVATEYTAIVTRTNEVSAGSTSLRSLNPNVVYNEFLSRVVDNFLLKKNKGPAAPTSEQGVSHDDVCDAQFRMSSGSFAR